MILIKEENTKFVNLVPYQCAELQELSTDIKLAFAGIKAHQSTLLYLFLQEAVKSHE